MLHIFLYTGEKVCSSSSNVKLYLKSGYESIYDQICKLGEFKFFTVFKFDCT